MSFYSFGRPNTTNNKKKTKEEKTDRSKFINKLAPREYIDRCKENEKAKVVEENISGSDISKIDRKIKIKMTCQDYIDSKNEKNKELNILLWSHPQENATNKILIEQKIRILRNQIIDIEKGYPLAVYLFDSVDIVTKNSINKSSSSSFLSSRNDNTNTDKLKYLSVANEYISLDNFKQSIQKLICTSTINGVVCDSTDFEYDDVIVYCKKCGKEIEIIDDTPSFKDIDRINMSNRYVYTKDGHFIDAMDKFEGNQTVEIKDEVYDMITKEMKYHNLTKETISKDHTYMFLAENGYSNEYENINLIYSKFTGKPAPNISEYRQNCLNRLEIIEMAYKIIKDTDKINSYNVNFKLFKILELEGYPCKKEDFYILKTQDRLSEHNAIWKSIIDHIINVMKLKGWRYIDTI